VAEYRIVAKVDPSGATAGAAKVKQELAGISSAAAATKTAIDRSFDQAAFDKSIGSLITRLDGLDKGLAEVVTSNGAVASSNSAVVKSLDAVATAAGRASTATSSHDKENKKATSSNASMEASLRKVLQATDAEALALMRMNELLLEAKRLFDAGKISQEQFSRVQKMGADAANGVTTATGSQRAGMQQLGYQLGDVATMYSLGAKPAQIFASQIGQITQAVQLMSNGTSKFASFLGGPWGIALSIAMIVLAPFVGKLFEGNNALDDAVKKLREDAKETEINRKAKEAFSRTIEGQIDAVRRLNEELDKSIRTQRQQQQITLYQAQQNVSGLERNRPGLVSKIDTQRARVNDLNAQIKNGGGDPDGVAALLLVASQADRQLKILETQLRAVDKAIADGARGVREAQVPLIQSDVEASMDKKAAATRRYTIELGRLNQQLAIGAGKQGRTNVMQDDMSFRPQMLRGIDTATYRRELLRIEKQKKDAEDAAAKEERDRNAAARATDGVARFRTRQQAIGLAGRELQRSGLNVGENEQFGGLKGNHPGMGAAHGKYAIDVNSGSGVVEANVPDLKSKFDQLAKRYQDRGYRVLWNGWVYEANGNGPARRIPAGQNQHRDHMHVEAPQTIVGKATQAADAADEIRDDNTAAKTAEQQRDFVAGIVDQAGARGQGNKADTVAAQIARVQADYARRFNSAMPKEATATVTKALTDADARETADRFDKAYVQPLERLRALQGKVGVDREVLNRQLEESARLGRELTPVEAAMIANGVRQGDALSRQAEILAQVKGPLQEYAAQVKALNELLAAGAINQTQYNARIADLGQGARSILNDMPGVDPTSGKEYSTIGAETDEDARYAKEQEDLANNREQLLKMGIDYDALVEAAAKRHADNMKKIDAGVKSARIQSAQSISESLLDIARNSVGEQSGIYKALFIASKAFAIADASIKGGQALAQALSLPFPANLAAMATVAASVATVVQSVQGIALNLADGGRVVGPGGPRSDSVPANLSNGEFVVNAGATSRNLSLLEAINSGSTVRRTRQATNDNAAVAAGNSRSRVSVQQHEGVAIETRENFTTGDVEIIAQRVLETHGDRVFASALDKPNSRARKSIQRNTTARGRKT
jgi:hypothetical protein